LLATGNWSSQEIRPTKALVVLASVATATAGFRWGTAASHPPPRAQEPRAPRASRLEGHSKKKLTDHGVCLINFRGTNQPQNICFLTFFFSYVLRRFSVSKGSSKTVNTINTRFFFLKQKVHVEKFFREISQKIDKNFDVSFSSTYFVTFFAFSGVTERWEFKNTTKNVLQKKSCQNILKRQKIQNRFFSILFYHVLGRFSVRGVQKHDEKSPQKI
jgi:hypothetical protein